jgi:hypothetical protein
MKALRRALQLPLSLRPSPKGEEDPNGVDEKVGISRDRIGSLTDERAFLETRPNGR